MLIADTDVVTFLLKICIRSLLCSAEWMLWDSQMHNVITLQYWKHACIHTQVMLTHTVTTGKHNRVFHRSHMTKLCNSQAQRRLLSHDCLSWVTSVGIKELLCVSWAFRLWGTFLLPVESKLMWGPTRFPISAAAYLCFFKGQRVWSVVRSFGRAAPWGGLDMGWCKTCLIAPGMLVSLWMLSRKDLLSSDCTHIKAGANSSWFFDGTLCNRAQPMTPAAAGRTKIQNSCCLKWLRDINLLQNHQSALNSLETFPNFVNQNHFSDIMLVFTQEPSTPGTSWAQSWMLPGCK